MSSISVAVMQIDVVRILLAPYKLQSWNFVCS